MFWRTFVLSFGLGVTVARALIAVVLLALVTVVLGALARSRLPAYQSVFVLSILVFLVHDRRGKAQTLYYPATGSR